MVEYPEYKGRIASASADRVARANADTVPKSGPGVPIKPLMRSRTGGQGQGHLRLAVSDLRLGWRIKGVIEQLPESGSGPVARMMAPVVLGGVGLCPLAHAASPSPCRAFPFRASARPSDKICWPMAVVEIPGI